MELCSLRATCRYMYHASRHVSEAEVVVWHETLWRTVSMAGTLSAGNNSQSKTGQTPKGT
jgi:hypothetical protein